jgi:biotin-(acetyl-CoA carboxylase) ligase
MINIALTKEELKLVKEYRKSLAEEKKNKKAAKEKAEEATLTKNLYNWDDDNFRDLRDDLDTMMYLIEEEVEAAVADFRKTFKIIAKKGEKIVSECMDCGNIRWTLPNDRFIEIEENAIADIATNRRKRK